MADKPLGRPSAFNAALCEKMISLYKSGKTDAEVAEIIGVCVRTIHIWKGKHPDFLHSLKEAKAIADDLVEASLFSRAIGYTHEAEQVFCSFGKVTRVKTFKHYPPDVTAQIFWLKNRRPDLWRETTTLNLESNDPDAKTTDSFEEFCKKAGYPSPFQKQLEIREYSITNGQPR